MTGSYLPKDDKLKKLVKVMFFCSLAVHLLLFIGMPKNSKPVINLEEDSEIEVDLGSIGEDPEDNIAAIKDTKVAEQATVPDNMLPQIAKNMDIKPEKIIEETEEDPEPQEDQKPEEVVEVDKKTEEKPPEEKPKDKKEEVKNKDSNTIDEAELQKRLALEKLKELAPKGKELRVQNNEGNLVAIKDTTSEQQKKNTGSSISPRVARACNAMVRKLMRNYYTLPPNYYIEKPDIQVQVDTKINDKGEIVKTTVSKPSGDKAFDEIVQNAIRKASPFPEVCFAYAGSTMKLTFSPKSL